MIDNELKEFIKEQRAKGRADNQIEGILVNHGWKLDDVRAAFDSLDLNVPIPKMQLGGNDSGNANDNANGNRNGSVADVTSEEGSRSDIWDAFENVIMFITMGCVAISMGLLLNYFIDNKLLNSPSPMGFGTDSELASVYVAILVVALPIFTFLFLRISKRTKENPALKNKLVRKVLTYITMIITSVLVIINLIVVVYRLLIENLEIEDFLDFVIIVGIGSLVFYYFLTQTKHDRKR